MKESEKKSIPFTRAVRVGNYKIWRSRFYLGKKKEGMSVECLNVSNLDGTWMTRVASTSSMYGLILQAYGEDAEKVLLGILSNMMQVCTSSSPYLHDAFFILTQMMTYPYMLLSEQDMADKMREGFNALGGGDTEKNEAHIAQMLEYRKELYALVEKKKTAIITEYEEQLAKRREQEKDSAAQMEQDDTAEKAEAVLSK